MAYGLSNGHAIHDVTWPPKVLWSSTVGYPSNSLASCCIWLTWSSNMQSSHTLCVCLSVCVCPHHSPRAVKFYMIIHRTNAPWSCIVICSTDDKQSRVALFLDALLTLRVKCFSSISDGAVKRWMTFDHTSNRVGTIPACDRQTSVDGNRHIVRFVNMKLRGQKSDV